MYHVICQNPVWFQVDLMILQDTIMDMPILQQETQILKLKKISKLMPKFISIDLFKSLYPEAKGKFILLLHSH